MKMILMFSSIFSLLLTAITVTVISSGNPSPCIDKGTILGGVTNNTSLPLPEDIFGWDIRGVPRYGKWPGDKPDIGAYEWIPPELQNSNGFWNGKTLSYNPLKAPNAPKDLRFIR